MKNKANPDDRRDNVERIQNTIDNTIENYRETKNMIKRTEDKKNIKELRC